jgi:hypothetical protein
MQLDGDLARTEPDGEIQDLIRASAGLNLALDYLPSSVAFDPMIETLDPVLASRIVWFDAYVTNVDRSVRNTNLLMWHRRPWLIDHGAALYVHHSPGWESQPERARAPFPGIRQHVLLSRATALTAVDADMASRLTPAGIHEIVGLIPGDWLGSSDATTEERERLRRAYEQYLTDRLAEPRAFVTEAIGVR